jgi:protein TonB
MAPPFHRADPPKRPDMSRIMESMLIHRVEPEYPILAAKTRTQGEVRLKAVISKEGTVEGLQVISGHPLLVAAALRAVQEWRYRPCLLNGQPIEVEASIIVRFTLAE